MATSALVVSISAVQATTMTKGMTAPIPSAVQVFAVIKATIVAAQLAAKTS